MTSRVWVLGAPDPEMEMIEALLRKCGERVEYATVYRDGARRRVTAGEAYVSDVAIGSDIRGLDATAYAVECQPAVLFGSEEEGIDWAGMAHRIDHHRPGDPGYGRPPSEFLPASSIGQVIAELARLERLPAEWRCEKQGLESVPAGGIRWNQYGPYWHVGITPVGAARRFTWGEPLHGYSLVLPTDIVLCAAADHCIAAAYRGECPGVDPDAIMRWRVETRAAFQQRSVEELLTDIERAREALREAPLVSLGFAIDAPGCAHHRGCAVPDCGACDYEGGALNVRDMRGYGLYRRTTVLVVPYVEGATCDASGTGDNSTTIVGRNLPTGAWDEGSHHTFVEQVSDDVPELPEAAAREGVAYLATVKDRDGRRKVVLGGRTTPEQVRAFLDSWVPAQGLVDTYGDPARGFAGGYLPAG